MSTAPAVPDVTAKDEMRGNLPLIMWTGLIGGSLGTLLYYGLLLLPVNPGSFYEVAVLATPVWVTHVLFVGLKVRRPGAILASSAITAAPAIVVHYILAWWSLIRIGGAGPFYDTRLGLALASLVPLVVTALVGEAIGLALWRRPNNINVDALLGGAALLGSMASVAPDLWLRGAPASLHNIFTIALDKAFLIRSSNFGMLAIAAVLAFVLSGLVPAAVAKSLANRVSSGSQAPLDGVLSEPSEQRAHSVPIGGLPEHPNATTALILGILGLVLFPPLAPVAWWFAAKGRSDARMNPKRYRESGSLQAGYVLGIVGTVALILGMAAFATFLTLTFANLR